MLTLLAGSFLGGGLGANDAANCFGTAVSSRLVSWRRASVLAAVFVVLGAISQGAAGLATLQGLTRQSAATAGLAALAAGSTLAGMTLLRLPASTSQAVVGAMVGTSLLQGGRVDVGQLAKIIACWVGTPVGAMLLTFALYYLLRLPLRGLRPSLFSMDPVLRAGLVVCGCYSAHALGANNVANVASFLVAGGHLTPRVAVALGSAAIAAGILLFSRGVMLTVGRGITPLDGLSALVVVLAQGVTVHLYALLGVPVSTSQAMIGAVLGMGLVKGVQILNLRTLGRILLGWFTTPLVGAALGGLLALLAGTG
jgi:inorganic phosphate transporter, PiT family